LSRNSKIVARWDRRDELKKGRAAAETLRAACPDAASVRVALEFRTATGEAHVPQVFSLFPPAKAHFVYPCPYGDCNGLFDLQAVGAEALREQKRARGTLKCTGSRCGQPPAGQACELQLNYSISLTMSRRLPAEKVPASVAGAGADGAHLLE
jgi:hypothetical protein